MTEYSQNDPRWRRQHLGNSNLTIGADGCVITSLGMLSDRTPDDVNGTLRTHGGFQGAAVIWNTAASVLGLVYDAETTRPTILPCIAVTDHYAHSGFPTHYFVLLDNGQIIDPLDGKTKANPYRIIGYRNLSPKEQPVTEDEAKNQRMNARADAMRFSWESWNPDGVIDMSSIYAEAMAIENGQLNQQELIDKWRDKAIQDGIWRRV